MIDKIKLLNLIAVMFFIFVFLNDTTVYNVFFEDISSVFIIIACLLLFLFICLIGKIYVNLKFWVYIFFWMLTVAISCGFAGYTSFFVVRVAYWTITILMVTTMHVANVDLKKVIYTVSKFFCVWCLLCYFYTSLNLNFLPITHVSDTLAYNYYSIELHGFVISKPISHLWVTDSINFLRLDRPFGEPGIAQIFMNYGLLYCLFGKNTKFEKKWFCIFILGSILTFSLIGYMILLCIFLFKLYKEKKYTLLYIFVIISIIVGGYMVIQKMSTFSYSDRMEDYVFMFKTIKDNIPFGIGIGNTNLLQRSNNPTFSKGFYCGLLYPIMQYGFFGIIYYLSLYLAIQNNDIENRNNNVVKFVFGIFLILTLLTEPQSDEPLILCFIFDGLINYFTVKKNKIIEEKKENVCG